MGWGVWVRTGWGLWEVGWGVDGGMGYGHSPVWPLVPMGHDISTILSDLQ